MCVRYCLKDCVDFILFFCDPINGFFLDHWTNLELLQIVIVGKTPDIRCGSIHFGQSCMFQSYHLSSGWFGEYEHLDDLEETNKNCPEKTRNKEKKKPLMIDQFEHCQLNI